MKFGNYDHNRGDHEDDMKPTKLFEPLVLRGLTLKNRIVISPMCQHSAESNKPGAWHTVHLGAFSSGGAGLVLVESTAVTASGRIGINDLGLWDDEQMKAFRPIIAFAHSQGAAIGVQLSHAGRKAGSQSLWQGGRALTLAELDATGQSWRRIGPSAISAGPGWSVPDEMMTPEIDEVIAAFVAAIRRADEAEFDVVELHFAHGYLVASFLSPVSNKRTDAYGGATENRMRLAVEVAKACRDVWPQRKPLFVRISAVDGADGGWTLDESVILARALRDVGVDVIDCSSGGLTEETRQANVPRGLGFQVPFADRIRRDAGVMTQAVGVILDGRQAEAILAEGKADLVAIGRQALFDPFWALHAAQSLGVDPEFALWPKQYGCWLAKRAPMLARLETGADH